MGRIYHGGPEVHKKPFPSHTRPPNRGADAGYKPDTGISARLKASTKWVERSAESKRALDADEGQRKRRGKNHVRFRDPSNKVRKWGLKFRGVGQ